MNACEFIISGVTAGVAGVYHVVGRCGDVPLQVGDVFDQFDVASEPAHPVNLHISRIVAYQRSLEELGSGMTASLDVQGQGAELLRPHGVLVASRPQNTFKEKGAAVSQAANNG
jgi:hypothetical protein